MTGKFIGAKVLYTRIKDIAYHSDNLRADDKGLQLFEALDIIEQKIKKACRYQKIPRNIEYHKVLVERYYIIKHTVHHVTAVVRYQIFRQKIKKENKQAIPTKAEDANIRDLLCYLVSAFCNRPQAF